MDIKLLILAVLPSIIIGLVIYYHDRYDKEPVLLILKTFLGGALIIIPVYIIENILIQFNIFSGIVSSFYLAFLVSGFTEEYFKRWVVLKTVYKHKEFNEKLDGIAYSVYAALGFATIENIMYISNTVSSQHLVSFYRGIFSVPAHSLFAITMGYYLALGKFCNDDQEKRKYILKSLWIPVILHGIFNFILLSRLPILMFLFIPFVIYLWIVNIRKIRAYIAKSKNDNRTEN